MAQIAARFYGDPTATLKVAGITGTNGKTTTAFLTRALTTGAGISTGLLGTVKSIVGGEERAVVRTTPEAIDLQRTFREMLEGGDTACVMETSSHALELKRADAIHVTAAVFNNLTQDHLDFHPTMEDYFQAKRLLFASPLTQTKIVNADDPYGRRLIEEFDCLTFAIEAEADYRAIDVVTDATGCDFIAVTPGRRVSCARAASRPVQRLERARPRGRRRGRSASRSRRFPTRWPSPRRRPAASSRSRRDSRSPSSSITRTSPTRSSRCCSPRARWRPAS